MTLEKVNFESDVDWLAFCYVADELPQQQRSEFEARLADDLEAQEAVARAMELSRDVYDARAVKTTLVTKQGALDAKSGWSPWWALVTAFLLGVTLAGWYVLDQNSAPVVSDVANEDLATLWADNIAVAEFISDIDEAEELEFESELDFEFESDEVEADQDWMMTAFELEPGL